MDDWYFSQLNFKNKKRVVKVHRKRFNLIAYVSSILCKFPSVIMSHGRQSKEPIKIELIILIFFF